MGKPKLRRPSIKALHQALINFRPQGPKTMTWVCIQPTKTHSFRDICNNFNSLYYSSSSNSISSEVCCSSSSSSSSSSSNLNDNEEETQTEAGLDIPNIRLPEAESISCSSFTSSSSLSIDRSGDSSPNELISKDSISSKRFFFSPCTTKSIMEEVMDPLGEETVSLEEEEGSSSCSTLLLEEEEKSVSVSVWRWESVTMEMTSENPYEDFRESMEEMVEAHGVKQDWSSLQELLHCYLRLNDSSVHDTIIVAFVDLLINLIAVEALAETDFNFNKSSSKSSSPLCLDSSSESTTIAIDG